MHHVPPGADDGALPAALVHRVGHPRDDARGHSRRRPTGRGEGQAVRPRRPRVPGCAVHERQDPAVRQRRDVHRVPMFHAVPHRGARLRVLGPGDAELEIVGEPGRDRVRRGDVRVLRF